MKLSCLVYSSMALSLLSFLVLETFVVLVRLLSICQSLRLSNRDTIYELQISQFPNNEDMQ